MLGFASIAGAAIGAVRRPLVVLRVAPLGPTAHYGNIGRLFRQMMVGYRSVTHFGVIQTNRKHTLGDLLHQIQPNMSMQETPKLTSITYGDGYFQDVPEGLTAMNRVLTMVWNNIDHADAEQIITYLRQTAGTKIQITAPRERSPRLWLTSSVRRSRPEPDGDNVTASFTETYP